MVIDYIFMVSIYTYTLYTWFSNFIYNRMNVHFSTCTTGWRILSKPIQLIYKEKTIKIHITPDLEMIGYFGKVG